MSNSKHLKSNLLLTLKTIYIMKKVFLTAMIFSFGMLFSQQDIVKTDFIKTVEEGKIKVLENDKWTYRNVKVITLKEAPVRFDKKDRYKLNQDRIDTPIEVTKIIMTDFDKDEYFDHAYMVNYELDKETSLLAKKKANPDMILMDTTTLNNLDNLTGEVRLNENRDFKITAIDDNNEEFEFILTTTD